MGRNGVANELIGGFREIVKGLIKSTNLVWFRRMGLVLRDWFCFQGLVKRLNDLVQLN